MRSYKQVLILVAPKYNSTLFTMYMYSGSICILIFRINSLIFDQKVIAYASYKKFNEISGILYLYFFCELYKYYLDSQAAYWIWRQLNIFTRDSKILKSVNCTVFTTYQLGLEK